MTIKLNKKIRPDDLTAKMPLRLFKGGDIVKTTDGQEGFIEFWAEDAIGVKAGMTRISARFTRLQAIRERRTEADWRALSDDHIAHENEEWKSLSSEALAIRTKSWLLVDTEGNVQEYPLSMENARGLYADEDHELREVALAWLKDNPGAFLSPKS